METIKVCNIWKLKCDITLKKGFHLCPICKGQGAEFTNAEFKRRKFAILRCAMCCGEGQVDWITAINKQIPKEHRLTTKMISMRCGGKQRCKKKLKRLWYEKGKPFHDIYFDMMMGRR